jgi:hypothetical protein
MIFRKDLTRLQMELFLPGLFVLLISSLFVFLVVPRVGSVILGVVSILTLVAVIIHHSHMFKDEYRLSTWQNQLGAYAPFVVLGFAILAILVAAASFVTGKAVTVQTPVEILQSSIQQSVSAVPRNSPAASLIPALGYKASNV